MKGSSVKRGPMSEPLRFEDQNLRPHLLPKDQLLDMNQVMIHTNVTRSVRKVHLFEILERF